jgi:hypothetical protein
VFGLQTYKKGDKVVPYTKTAEGRAPGPDEYQEYMADGDYFFWSDLVPYEEK